MKIITEIIIFLKKTQDFEGKEINWEQIKMQHPKLKNEANANVPKTAAPVGNPKGESIQSDNEGGKRRTVNIHIYNKQQFLCSYVSVCRFLQPWS